MRRRTLRWLLTAAGIAAFVLLLRQFGLPSILAIVGRVRWALLFLLVLQIVSEVANAAGWRLCFPPGHGRSPAFSSLMRLRVAGDGINYLIPTATIGGELLRIDQLDPRHARSERTASVVLARLAQDLALASLAATGFWIVARRTIGARTVLPSVGFGWVAAAAALGAGLVAATWRWAAARGEATRAGRMRRRIEQLVAATCARLRSHPARFAAAAALFGAGYLWGAVEAFWICRLIGRPVAPGTAVQIEILSLTIDAIVFLVPARIGTQEAGKTLVFMLLGLPGRDGFAFGLIRHVRELCWAGIGVLASGGNRRD